MSSNHHYHPARLVSAFVDGWSGVGFIEMWGVWASRARQRRNAEIAVRASAFSQPTPIAPRGTDHLMNQKSKPSRNKSRGIEAGGRKDRGDGRDDAGNLTWLLGKVPLPVGLFPSPLARGMPARVPPFFFIGLRGGDMMLAIL
jgi:hypothetical protein